MALDSYNKLLSTVAWYANRDDLFSSITTFSPTAIDGAIDIALDMAESSIDADIASRGGIKYAETVDNSLTVSTTLETFAPPTGFKSVKVLMLTTTPSVVLTPKSAIDLFNLYPDRSLQGKPEAYAVVGSTIYLSHIGDQAYSTRLIYNKSLSSVALSSSNTTNWLLTNGPQVYLGAIMVELCIMLENDERLQFWKGYYDQKMNDFMGDDRMTRWTAVDATPRPIGSIV